MCLEHDIIDFLLRLGYYFDELICMYIKNLYKISPTVHGTDLTCQSLLADSPASRRGPG